MAPTLILINLSLHSGQRFPGNRLLADIGFLSFLFFAGMDDGGMFRILQEGVCIF